MKDIVHFSIGVALASFVPAAVQAAQRGNPWYFLLGGICGLLPDTLDLKFARFLCRHDVEIMPDPLNPDAAVVARGVVAAAMRASETGKPVCLKLHTVRLGAEAWLPYTVTILPVPVNDRSGGGGRVEAVFHRPVDGGGAPLDASPPGGVNAAATVLAPRVRIECAADTRVDIHDGPVLELRPEAHGVLTPVFQPWRRLWSHGVLVAFAVGGLAFAAGGAAAAIIASGAVAAHALVDRLDGLGTNALFPLRRRRSAGLRRIHSMNATANVLAVWPAVWLTFWNLARQASFDAWPLNSARAAVWGLAATVPLAWLYRRARTPELDTIRDCR